MGLPIGVLLTAALVSGHSIVAAGSSDGGRDGGRENGVAVTTRSGERSVRCPEIDSTDPEKVEGGCVARASGSYVEMDVKSMVGDFEFSSCVLDYELRIDGSGRTVISDATIEGRSPCSDAIPCFTEADGRLPWHGRLRRDANGSLHNDVDMCLDTCMGRFEGPFTMDLRPSARGWHVTARDEPVGMSGWHVDGEWDIRVEGVSVEGT